LYLSFLPNRRHYPVETLNQWYSEPWNIFEGRADRTTWNK
jgi:hypothetical protein